MKIKKQELLKFISTAIQNAEAKHAAETKQRREFRDKEAAEWEAVFGQQWDNALAAMQKARKKKEPITRDMIPEGRYGKAFFDTDRSDPVEFTPPQDLIATRALITAMEDESIDVKSLAMSELRDLYRKYA